MCVLYILFRPLWVNIYGLMCVLWEGSRWSGRAYMYVCIYVGVAMPGTCFLSGALCVPVCYAVMSIYYYVFLYMI